MDTIMNRRKVMKYGVMGLAGFLASIATVTLDRSQGFKLGEIHKSVKIGVSEAHAVCAAGMGCGGSGGQCGAGLSCGGGRY